MSWDPSRENVSIQNGGPNKKVYKCTEGGEVSPETPEEFSLTKEDGITRTDEIKRRVVP